MPRIFDNISERLLTALTNTIKSAKRADFCVGYFNLRGWKLLQSEVEHWTGEENNRCRILVGMQRAPQDELRQLFNLTGDDTTQIDQQKVVRLKRQIVDEFRRQLMVGAPTNQDEQGLHDLVRQLKAKKVVVKLFLRHPLHAKLYLMHREDYNAPTMAFLGSSNLTFSGLSYQGELNTEVNDYDACQKLNQWFEARWQDRWCLDISDDLIEVIEDSWAREDMLSPYEVYLKMAYHMAQEARAGLSEFKLPREFANQLFDYQAAAVQIAAHHLNKRGGVLLGDVVGLGKTLMATALVRLFQDDYSWETLILCPKNLVSMWEKYVKDYRLIAEVMSLSQVDKRLPTLRRYRLVIIDESHNLRNREGRRYNVIKDYITTNESRCILLSATPYNKSYLDLSSQLRLFIQDDRDLGIRPEKYLHEIGEAEFIQRHQAPLRSLAAFEKSEYADDWRELMRLYLVRRTRSFIMNNYAEIDPENGRQFMRLRDGRLSYFPARVPRTVMLKPSPQYQRLYSDEIVNRINALSLPRYGLGQYVSTKDLKNASAEEKKQIENLSRAGQRLKGFSRTNLFKRLESSGMSFLQSLDRHILRNYVFLHAIENGMPLPIGTLDADMLDPNTEDEDTESLQTALESEDNGEAEGAESFEDGIAQSKLAYIKRAQEAYSLFSGKYKKRFKWLRSALFTGKLKKQLEEDNRLLLEVLNLCGEWDTGEDTKLTAIYDLITQQHPTEKVLVFSQFADTIRYLHDKLKQVGVRQLAAATGQSDDPTHLAHRFSPISNGVQIAPEEEIRVLLSTDVLSEGQNLQDSAIVINYDLPWAIIRLSQRAGRVDRIGQQAEQIYCYSFLPAEGIEQIIRLRARVRQRLHENGEVVGSDEQFFEEDNLAQQLRDLYTEKSGILDIEADTEVDLSSYAYQIWANATKHDPVLGKKIADLPDVVYSSRHYTGSSQRPEGVLTYVKTADGVDALVWLDKNGNIITESQLAILRAAECPPDTPPQGRHPLHHELVQKSVELTQEADYMAATGGQLGRPNSARRRTYDKLSNYLKHLKANMPLFVPDDLERAIDDIYRYPLRSSATDTLGRQLRSGISDHDLADLVISLWKDDRLSLVQEEGEHQDPRILCSLGLFTTSME
jgi:superfamily II DNA or RNA helicase